MKDSNCSCVFASLDELKQFASGGVLQLCDIVVLLYLDAHNAAYAAALADALGVARPTISRSLKRLSSAELVEETVNRNDFRISLYRLSSRGEHVVFEVKKKFGVRNAEQYLREYAALQHAARAAIEGGARKTQDAAQHAMDEKRPAAQDATQGSVTSYLSESALRILLVLGQDSACQAGHSQAEICTAAHLAQNRTSAAIDALCKKGLLAKTLAQHDRRTASITLTEQGKHVANRLLGAYRQHIEISKVK